MICRTCTKVVFTTSHLNNDYTYEHAVTIDEPENQHDATPMTTIEEMNYRIATGTL